jgi:restriction endonuclease
MTIMPTISGMNLPLPKHWQEFETITRDAMALKWKSPNLQKNGRSGQKQHGVDIWGADDIGRRVGIQCKRYKPPLTFKTVAAEVENAETFGKLTTLWIATTGDHDSPLQQKVRTLSDHRVAQDKFAVGILFWEDVVDGLILNPSVFRAHYPQVTLDTTTAVNKERLIAALDLGYFGADLWSYVILTYGEYGWMAQADPDELISTLRVLEQRASQLLPPDDAVPILESLSAIREGCDSPKNKKSDWDPVEVHAKRVSNRLGRATSLLPVAESNMLDLALQLGRLYHTLDDLPRTAQRGIIESKVRAVLPPSSDGAIRRKFADAKKLRSGYRWVIRIYSLLDHELRWSLT